MRRALKLVPQPTNRNVLRSDRLNCPRLSHSLKLSGSVWSGRCKAPVAEVVVRATDNALRRVGEQWHQRRAGSRRPVRHWNVTKMHLYP